MKKFTVDPHANQTQLVGRIDQEVIQNLLGITFPVTDVYMYPGFIKHVRKRHPKIFEKYYSLIPEIILNPDYVGHNPKEPNSIELVKMIKGGLLLAIKLSPGGYLYLSSMYAMKNGEYKVKKRIRSGRLVPYNNKTKSMIGM